MPAKCDELWAMLALPGKASDTRGEAARPSFGPRATPRVLGTKGILFPRLEVQAVKAALAPPAAVERGA
jgi:hypothetical protein